MYMQLIIVSSLNNLSQFIRFDAYQGSSSGNHSLMMIPDRNRNVGVINCDKLFRLETMINCMDNLPSHTGLFKDICDKYVHTHVCLCVDGVCL